MNTSTDVIESRIQSLISSLQWIRPESADLQELYWAEVNSDSTYTGLAVGDAATFSTKLTKQELTNALTIAEQVDKFFSNQSLAQADYLANIQGIRYGNDERASPGISKAVEAYGERSLTFVEGLLSVYKLGEEIDGVYFASELSGAIGGISGDVLPWSNTPKSDFVNIISLIQNLNKLLNNEVATQGDYDSILSGCLKAV